MNDATMPQPVPGQGDCPPGYRPASVSSQPGAARECVPIGPNVPLGGWKPVAPGGGRGYPPTASDAFSALAQAVAGEDGQYVSRYVSWLGR